MTDDAPFSRYSEPHLNPFPDPGPPEPKPSFVPPLVPYAGIEEKKLEAEKFEQEFDKDIFKLVFKIVIFIILVIAGSFLIWHFTKKVPSEPLPETLQNGASNVLETSNGAEIGESVNLISAIQGGLISYADEDGQILEIIIPAGALKEDTKISVRQISKGFVTNRYQFAPKGLKFLFPATVKIPYKENGLKKGETPYDIKLEYQAEPGRQKYLLWYEADEAAKKLKTQVMGF
ncbi:hypothetical protein HZC21_03075 [Candidatus Peregrinibacteria bacterium]|nr:hypothetical protein [Candidatus Peregrinibacteria bacterium]